MGCIEISHEISRSHHANLYHQWLGVDQFLGKLIHHVTFTHSPRLIHYSIYRWISAGLSMGDGKSTGNYHHLSLSPHPVSQIAAALHLTASGDRQAASLQ